MAITQIIDGIVSRGFWFNLGHIIVIITTLLLGLLAYRRNPKNLNNRSFAWLCFSFSIWSLAMYISDFIFLPHNFVLLITRFTFATGFLLAISYFYFCSVFPDKGNINKPYYLFLVSISIVFAVISLVTPWVVKDYIVRGPFTLVAHDGGLYMPVFLLYALLAFSAVFILYLKLRKLKGNKRTQVNYVFLGALLFVIYIFATDLIPQLIGITDYSRYGALGVIFFVVFTSYAVFKHRLMDIRLVVLKSAVYTTLIGLITVSYIVLIYYLKKYYEQAINLDIVFVLAILVATFGFQPLRIRLQKLADQWFSKSNYNFQELLKKISNILSTNLVIDDLSEQLLKTLITEMKIQKAVFVLKDGFQKSEAFNLKKQEVARLFSMAQLNSALVADELEDDDSRKKHMRKLGIEVIIYFSDDGKAIGFLALSEKASGDAYSSQDLKLLEIIAPQITIALKNIEQQQQMIEQIVEERQRINQDAHDHIYNRLGALAKKAEVALESPNDVKPTLELLKDDLRKSVTDLQRIVSGEAEQDSTECLVKEELESIIKDFTNKSNVDLTFNCDSSVTKKLNPQHFWHFQCILEECLNNVHKHSKATEVDVSIISNNGSIIMQVKDNGIGLRQVRSQKSENVVGRVPPPAGRHGRTRRINERSSGLGLKGMKERAKKMNADLNFSSNGHGTTVELKVPILT